MSSFLNDTFASISRRAAKMVGSAAGASVDTVRHGASSGQEGLRHAYEVAAQSKQGKQFMGVVRTAAIAGPVKEVAYICGRAGVAGAVVDGAVGGLNAAKFLRQGKIDGTQAAKHVAAETGCGFVTSSSGTAGTIAVYMITGSMGPAAMAVGMGASIGSRWAYRKIVGDTLPTDEDKTEHEEDAVEESDVIEEIGPRPSK
jgi:hypothetical protein